MTHTVITAPLKMVPSIAAGNHLRLIGENGPCDGLVMDNKAFFLVSLPKQDLCLVSPHRPIHSHDKRQLGVIISEISIEDGYAMHKYELNNGAISRGFYTTEIDGENSWRWTNGAGYISKDLLIDVRGPFVLRLRGVFQF